jgi:hypothetical protein
LGYPGGEHRMLIIGATHGEPAIDLSTLRANTRDGHPGTGAGEHRVVHPGDHLHRWRRRCAALPRYLRCPPSPRTHRVCKNYDPRAKIVKKTADDVLHKLGVNDPLLEIAVALEAKALADDYFVERKLYPNVDFYTEPDLPPRWAFPPGCSPCSSCWAGYRAGSRTGAR